MLGDYLLEITHTSPSPGGDLSFDLPLPERCVPHLLITIPLSSQGSKIRETPAPKCQLSVFCPPPSAHTQSLLQRVLSAFPHQKTLQQPYWP